MKNLLMVFAFKCLVFFWMMKNYRTVIKLRKLGWSDGDIWMFLMR